MKSIFPKWLRIAWLSFCPFGLVFAVRIAWEKTVWTWQRGPQMVGLSLMHKHPAMAAVGILCCYALMLWLVPGAIYAIVRREKVSRLDSMMLAICLFVAAAVMIPDGFFAFRG